jgi:phosphoribosylanthranilate isomerase
MARVKICGLTSLKDSLGAAELGAELLGFNFYPKSPRYITPTRCASITKVVKLRYPGTILAGVFVDSSLDEIEAIVRQCQLDRVQLHGDESPALLAALRGKAYKAFRRLPETIDPYIIDVNNPPVALVDAHVEGAYGGTGVTGDWQAARQLAQRYAILLAGGLTTQNVIQAIEQVSPWGVDTASGVEVAPGIKDPQKMAAFIKAAHETV